MDQKLLNALNNLSEALQEISDALKSKGGNSATANALQSGDFISEIKEISVGIKQLQIDNKKILKNQETIIQLSKKAAGDKKSDFEKAGGDKKQESNIKKGVGTILLIAVAVLAIGVAFKLVGGIDFLSVIGLSIAILVVAKAFEQVALLKMSLKESAIVSAALIMMATGITISSWIMSKISTISIAQSLTAILIGVGFSTMAPAIRNIISSFGGMGWGSIIKAAVGLVMVLPAIAMGITLSSWVLRMITPIGFGQAITAILIAGMFTVLSFSIKKLIKAFGTGFGTLVKAVLFLPLVLPAIALGIAMSSWVLQKITPITFSQAVSAILIGAMFTVIAFGLKKLLGAFGGNAIIGLGAAILFLPTVMGAIADGIVRASSHLKKTEKVGWTQAWSAILIAGIFTVISFGLKNIMNAMDSIDNPLGILLVPLLLPAVAYAIQLSSEPLSKVSLMTMDQFWTSLGISVLFIAFAFALKLIGPSIEKIGMGVIIKIPLMFTALSGAIWASSKILSQADVMSDDFLMGLLKFSTVLAISVAAMAGVTFLLNKVGFTNIIKGVIAIPIIAGVIMASSLILSLGKYDKKSYPSLDWALGVAASVGGFALGAAILGPMVFGPQAFLFAAGLAAVLAVAGTVVAASHILSKGDYKGGPDLIWSLSVSKVMKIFGGLTALLGVMPKSWVKDGNKAIRSVVDSIVYAAWIFKGADAAFTGGPTKAWAEGVGIAIGAFSPVYAMMMANGVAKLFGGGGVGPKEFSDAIRTVSRGIIDAAGIFANPENTAVWINGPTKAWAEGVGTAISAFSPVYSMLLKNGIAKLFGGGGVGPKDFALAITTISQGIIDAAGIFAENVSSFEEGKYPSSEWGKGVGGAITAFAPVFKALSEDTGWFTSGDEVINNMVNGVLTVAGAIVGVANKFSADDVNWTKFPDKNWSYHIKNVVNSYVALSNSVNKKKVTWSTLNSLRNVVNSIATTARIFGKNSKYFNMDINPDFMKSISSNIYYYMEVYDRLQNRSGGLTGFLKNTFNSDPVISMSKGMVVLAKAYDRLANSLTKMGKAMDSLNDKKISQLERMSNIAAPSLIGYSGTPKMSNVNSPDSASSKRSSVDSSKSIKGKYGSSMEQNDIIIELLKKLNSNIGEESILSMYLLKNMENKDSTMY